MAGISVSHPVMISTIIKWVWLLQVCSVISTVSIWVVRWCFRLIQVIISPSVVMLLHWRMPWNMISAVAILMLCNGIRISLKSKKNTINEIGCVMEFMTHLFRFFIFFIEFHGWIGRHSCLSDYSRNFADIWPLANGSRPIYAPVVFVTQISQMAQIFLRGDYFVPQISQIYTDFSLGGLFCPTDFADDADFSLWGLFCPTDFTDIHRFFFVGLFPSSGVSAPTGQVASAKIRE